MMKKYLLILGVSSCFAASPVIEMTGGAAVMSPDEHFRQGELAFGRGEWANAAFQFGVVTRNYPQYEKAALSHYMGGKSYYALRQWDFAEREFSRYLEKSVSANHFEEVIRFKFDIANRYKEGVRKHLFGLKKFPKWMPAKEDAIRLYDEVAMALPSSELAAESLYAKGHLLWMTKRYQEAAEAYQAFIYRFPNHAYAPESYLCIGKLYANWCKEQPQNPDILPLAFVNVRKFRKEFPADERLIEAEGLILGMREVLANSMWETARYYERTGKPEAARVYYQEMMRQYPKTEAGHNSEQALALLEE